MFEQEITQLAREIREAVRNLKAANSILTRQQVRVRRRDLSLRYGEDVAFGNFAPVRLEEDIWDWHDQDRFQGSVVNGVEEYKTLVSAVGPKTQLIEHFARTVCFASFHGLDDEELKERGDALGRELEGGPLPVKVTAFLDGLSICESPLVISNRFLLRKPAPEDVAEYILFDEYGGFSFPSGDTWFRVVGEFVFDAVATGAAQKEFLRAVEALPLFRVGGVAANRYTMRSRHTFLQGGGMVLRGPNRQSRFAYSLSSSDAATLNKFLGDVVPLLPDPFQLDKAATEREVAYTRYRDALFQDGPSERAITSAITALEALFLVESTELTHRLAQRVSVFLRVLGTQLDAQTTYENVKSGYRIRSTFIHGGSTKDRPRADSLAPVLLEYARECVLAFFQMPTRKDEVLSQLDRAMIDSVGVKELESTLTPVLYR